MKQITSLITLLVLSSSIAAADEAETPGHAAGSAATPATLESSRPQATWPAAALWLQGGMMLPQSTSINGIGITTKSAPAAGGEFEGYFKNVRWITIADDLEYFGIGNRTGTQSANAFTFTVFAKFKLDLEKCQLWLAPGLGFGFLSINNLGFGQIGIATGRIGVDVPITRRLTAGVQAGFSELAGTVLAAGINAGGTSIAGRIGLLFY